MAQVSRTGTPRRRYTALPGGYQTSPAPSNASLEEESQETVQAVEQQEYADDWNQDADQTIRPDTVEQQTLQEFLQEGLQPNELSEDILPDQQEQQEDIPQDQQESQPEEPQSEPEDIDMAQPVAAERPIEIRIAQPDTFDGSRKKAESFLLNTSLYLRTNGAIYNNDMKRILFILSLMKEGTTEIWKRNFIKEKEQALNDGEAADPPQRPAEGAEYGTIADFFTRFQQSFVSTETQTKA